MKTNLRRVDLLVCVLIAGLAATARLASAADYTLPDRVQVLPVAFVCTDEKPPTPDESALFLRHLHWTRDRYREMLRDTFELAGEELKVVSGQKPLDYYRPGPERGAPEIVSELLTHFRLTRFNCPYVFCILLMNSRDSFPEGGGRPINGGINTGGGMMYIASWELTHNKHFQTTLQHELGHAFGLTHVDVFGYDMQTNASIMSYNPAHHCQGFEPSKSPGTLIPEDRRGLAMNDRVFAETTFQIVRDVPFGYQLSSKLAPLGPMTLPGQPDFYPQVKTSAGADFQSNVTNIVREEIKANAGPGVTYDPNTMWHSARLPAGQATLQITFPMPVTLSGISVHSQHSGMYHEAKRIRIATNDEDSIRQLVEQPLKSADETITFEPATATRWTLTLTAGASQHLVLRGLRFFDGKAEVCPHLIPN